MSLLFLILSLPVLSVCHHLNYITDMSDDEFKRTQLTLESSVPKMKKNVNDLNAYLGVLPPTLDWRHKGVVTPIKNQGLCGACWSFSTVSAIESIVAINHGQLMLLSEQQLVDCSSSHGCRGGYIIETLDYIDKNGLCSGKYQYHGSEGSCNKCNPIVKLNDYRTVSGEKWMLQALQTGPIIVEINSDPLKTYGGGILDKSSNCGVILDHAVVIVGYDEKNWIVRNSWGLSWGENGYFRIMRGFNLCGIETVGFSVNATQVGEYDFKSPVWFNAIIIVCIVVASAIALAVVIYTIVIYIITKRTPSIPPPPPPSPVKVGRIEMSNV